MRNERTVSERIWSAQIIRGALHVTGDAALVAEVTTGIVRVCEGAPLEDLDAVLVRAIGLLSGARVGALKKACDGVLSRAGALEAKHPASKAAAKKSAPTDTKTASLFAAEPAPVLAQPARIVPPAGELVFVDTETTGLKAGAHQVIEIGAMTSEGAEFVALVRLERGAEVSPDAMRINGIDLRGREWRESAVSLRDALDSFVRWLPTGAVLVAHNAAFDRRMLEGDAARVGVDWPTVEWFCTKTWADDLRKRGALACADSKLHTLCAHYGIPNDGEHRALADVVRMARVFDELSAIGAEREAA